MVVANVDLTIKSKIFVIGDVMLDLYCNGEVKRISREAPVPIVKFINQELRLGGTANVTANLKSQNYDCELFGITGADENHHTLRSLLNKAKIDACILQDTSTCTITKMRIQNKSQQLIRLDYEKPINPELSKQLWQKFNNKTTSVIKAIILSDYAKGSLHNPQAYIHFAREHNIPIVIDPKGNDYTKYKNAFCITPNESEFINVMGEYTTDDKLEQKMSSLGKQLNLCCLLVTRGAEGMSLWLEGDKFHHVKSQAKEVFDVSGAGDTVIATLVGNLKLHAPPYSPLDKSQRENIIQAVETANFAAGLVVAKLGTATISQDELNLNCSKRLTQENIDNWVSQCRQQGLSIAFTNGCFDLLHKGHIHYLCEAAKYADRLIVAVNSDASVKRLKNEHRPINWWIVLTS